MRRALPLLILILLVALGLRLFQLTEIPPGLTHDEANHGREAIEILDGVLRYYFPLNYGSEPIYSYTVAGSMALFGENLFALRLVNVIFGLATIIATAVWSRQAFDKATALVAAGLLAVSFWPLASSREALRAGMLPFFMVLSVWFFWQLVCNPCGVSTQPGNPFAPRTPSNRRRTALLILGFALSLVATFHIYLAARVAWLLFPLFLIYLALFHSSDFRRSWRPALLGLLLAGLLLIPMFIYLANNPFAQTRLSMLDGTLGQVAAGQLGPVMSNAVEAFLAFFWPGYGDQFLAYNIPGRPVFDFVSAVFFLLGLLVSLRRWRQPAYAFLLIWFATGILPSLVTGPTANTTRNMAALPAVFLLAAVGFVWVGRALAGRFHWPERAVLAGGALVWLLLVTFLTVQDYFITWGTAADVRGAYQHTLTEQLAYLEQPVFADRPIVMSTVYPGPVHDPSIAKVLGGDATADFRWVDARSALLLPLQETYALVPSSTPFHPAFAPYLEPIDRVVLREDDLDPEFTVYELHHNQGSADGLVNMNADFGGAVTLVGARWLTAGRPGETAELLTSWQVDDPQAIGPLHPPAFEPDTVFFTHLLDETGTLISQHDALGAPSWSWQQGDTVLQIHRLLLPAELPVGSYQPLIGIYDRETGERLPLHGAEGPTAETLAEGPVLEVAQSAE